MMDNNIISKVPSIPKQPSVPKPPVLPKMAENPMHSEKVKEMWRKIRGHGHKTVTANIYSEYDEDHDKLVGSSKSKSAGDDKQFKTKMSSQLQALKNTSFLANIQSAIQGLIALAKNMVDKYGPNALLSKLKLLSPITGNMYRDLGLGVIIDSVSRLSSLSEGILKNALDKLLDKTFISTRVYLLMLKMMKEDLHSDLTVHDNYIRGVAIDRDLIEVIEWIDQEYGFKYTGLRDDPLLKDLFRAARHGSYRVTRYIVNQMKEKKKELIEAFKREPVWEVREHIISSVEFIEDNIAKAIKLLLIKSCSSVSVGDFKILLDESGIDPSVFGDKDTKFGGKHSISDSDLDRIAPVTDPTKDEDFTIDDDGNIVPVSRTRGGRRTRTPREKRKHRDKTSEEKDKKSRQKRNREREPRTREHKFVKTRNKHMKRIHVMMSDHRTWGNRRLRSKKVHKRLRHRDIDMVMKKMKHAFNVGKNIVKGVIGVIAFIKKEQREAAYTLTKLIEPFLHKSCKPIKIDNDRVCFDNPEQLKDTKETTTTDDKVIVKPPTKDTCPVVIKYVELSPDDDTNCQFKDYSESNFHPHHNKKESDSDKTKGDDIDPSNKSIKKDTILDWTITNFVIHKTKETDKDSEDDTADDLIQKVIDIFISIDWDLEQYIKDTVIKMIEDGDIIIPSDDNGGGVFGTVINNFYEQVINNETVITNLDISNVNMKLISDTFISTYKNGNISIEYLTRNSTNVVVHNIFDTLPDEDKYSEITIDNNLLYNYIAKLIEMIIRGDITTSTTYEEFDRILREMRENCKSITNIEKNEISKTTIQLTNAITEVVNNNTDIDKIYDIKNVIKQQIEYDIDLSDKVDELIKRIDVNDAKTDKVIKNFYDVDGRLKDVEDILSNLETLKQMVLPDWLLDMRKYYDMVKNITLINKTGDDFTKVFDKDGNLVEDLYLDDIMNNNGDNKKVNLLIADVYDLKKDMATLKTQIALGLATVEDIKTCVEKNRTDIDILFDMYGVDADNAYYVDLLDTDTRIDENPDLYDFDIDNPPDDVIDDINNEIIIKYNSINVLRVQHWIDPDLFNTPRTV